MIHQKAQLLKREGLPVPTPPSPAALGTLILWNGLCGKISESTASSKAARRQPKSRTTVLEHTSAQRAPANNFAPRRETNHNGWSALRPSHTRDNEQARRKLRYDLQPQPTLETPSIPLQKLTHRTIIQRHIRLTGLLSDLRPDNQGTLLSLTLRQALPQIEPSLHRHLGRSALLDAIRIREKHKPKRALAIRIKAKGTVKELPARGRKNTRKEICKELPCRFPMMGIKILCKVNTLHRIPHDTTSGGEGSRTPVLDTVDASISMFRRRLAASLTVRPTSAFRLARNLWMSRLMRFPHQTPAY